MASSHVETSSVETTADARFDFITKLADLNLLIVIEHIVQHAGYDATLNMLCVSKAWNEILLDIERPGRRGLSARVVVEYAKDDTTRQQYDGNLDEVPAIFSLMDPLQGADRGFHDDISAL